MRRWAIRLHRWGGLLTGPPLLVLGLSGGVLVFAPELDDALNGPPPVRAAPAEAPSLDALVAAARLAHPGGAPRALHAPARAGQPWRVELEVGGRRLDAWVEPVPLAVVESRAPDRSPLLPVRSLHAAFHAGAAGAVLVGLLGAWLVVVSASGLWLYGPLATRRARRGGRRLHRLLGALSVAVGIVVGLTGAALAAAAVVAAPAAAPPAGRLARLDAVAAAATAALPGARVTALVAEAGGRVRVRARLADGRAASVLVDADRGAVVADPAPSRPGAEDLVRRLHVGDFAGWPSRLVWASLGIALAVLSVTGFLIGPRRGPTGRAGRDTRASASAGSRGTRRTRARPRAGPRRGPP
jgi:uncharacterized iron-regulated membrane protein